MYLLWIPTFTPIYVIRYPQVDISNGPSFMTATNLAMSTSAIIMSTRDKLGTQSTSPTNAPIVMSTSDIVQGGH